MEALGSGWRIFTNILETGIENAPEAITKRLYPTAYPEAHTRWQEGQTTVNTISKIAIIGAVILIANEVLKLATKGFRASTLPTIYAFAEVAILSRSIKKVFNDYIGIPAYFDDKELFDKHKKEIPAATAAQNSFYKALEKALQKSLAYRLYDLIERNTR